MAQEWKYYGRDGGGPDIFEIFRFPNNGVELDLQDWKKYPEWLLPDGSWVFFPDDDTVKYERVVGHFDECLDEITEEKVRELYRLWSTNGWRENEGGDSHMRGQGEGASNGGYGVTSTLDIYGLTCRAIVVFSCRRGREGS